MVTLNSKKILPMFNSSLFNKNNNLFSSILALVRFIYLVLGEFMPPSNFFLVIFKY